MANITSDKRREKFWQRMANKNVKVPKPRTREEILLKAIGDNINRSSTAVDPADITAAVNNYLEENPVSAETAYESAVSGGYQGTETEFKQALAGIETMSKEEMLNILRGGDNA